MTLDGFLTFLTLIIAAYGIVPSVMRLRLRLHTVLLATISLIAFVLVIYFETYPLFARPCPAQLEGMCRWIEIPKPDTGSSPLPGQVAFGLVITWIVLAILVLIQPGIPVWSIPTLQRLVDELIHEQRYSELVKVAEPHLIMLDRVARRKLRLMRLRGWLEKRRRGRRQKDDGFYASIGMELPPPPTVIDHIKRWGDNLLASLRHLIPLRQSLEDSATEILRAVLLTRAFTEYVALFRPATGVALLRVSTHHVHTFCDEYLTVLASNTKSTLYAELENNQNLERGHEYAFPPRNQLLHYLFADARTAERLGVWKPLGEWLIEILRPAKNSAYTSLLNLSGDHFEREKWQDPAYAIVFFFDLMVTAAEFQGVEWHMWLFYYPHFLDGLIAVYDDTGPEVDPHSERPTRAAYLIAEIFHNMRRWIVIVNELDPASPHLVMENQQVRNENGNIPKSAILALGSSLHALWGAENIGEDFKLSIYDNVVRTIGELPRIGDRSTFRAVLIRSLIEGGPRFSREHQTGYRDWLRRLYFQVDHVVRERLVDYEAALNMAG